MVIFRWWGAHEDKRLRCNIMSVLNNSTILAYLIHRFLFLVLLFGCCLGWLLKYIRSCLLFLWDWGWKGMMTFVSQIELHRCGKKGRYA